MTLKAKILIKAFYGHEARLSYWSGCSGGGREGLLQAYRYPDEFNGIIAGDPANIRRNAWALWLAVQTFKDPLARIPSEKYPMIHRAVLDTCDGNDGLKDGLIEDPKTCDMEFKKLECKGADGPDCLTARQVKTADTIISPAATPAGEVLFPRLEPGTELRWNRLAGGPSLPIFFSTSSAMSFIKILSGIGGALTWKAMLRRRMPSTKISMNSIHISRSTPNTAASF